MSGPGAVRSLGAIASAQLHVGTPALRTAVDDVLTRAAQHAHVDVFRLDDKGVVEMLHAASSRGIRLSVLADTDSATGRHARRLAEAAGDGWSELGGDPLKQHGKSLTRDGGAEALVATDIADGDAGRRIELAATFSGSAARSLSDLHAASAGSLTQLRDALDAAAAQGVLANDPRTDAWHVTRGINLLVREPSPYLRVMTKSFDSADAAEQLAAAARTRPVELLTHDLPRSQRRLLTEAGVAVRVIDEADAERAATALHGTLIDTGDRALITSAYLEDRVLHGSSGRQSRELGVLLKGDAAAQARAAYDQVAAVQPG